MKKSRMKWTTVSVTTFVAIVAITIVMAQNMGNRAPETQVKLTDANLLAAQAKQDELLATQKRLEAGLKREEALRAKVEDAQASFRRQSVELQAQHEKERTAWQSTANFYQGKWQEARRPVPLWATAWAGGLYGIILVLALQAFHRFVKRAHGSYKKFANTIWARRPRMTWGGGPSHV